VISENTKHMQYIKKWLNKW